MSEDNGDAKRDRDPFEQRYSDTPSETTETVESPETSKREKTSNSSKSAESSESKKSEKSIRDRKNVNMYLPEGLVTDLQIRYSELDARWRAEHGESLPKNREFYPAVVRASINETTIAKELGLTDSSE